MPNPGFTTGQIHKASSLPIGLLLHIMLHDSCHTWDWETKANCKCLASFPHLLPATAFSPSVWQAVPWTTPAKVLSQSLAGLAITKLEMTATPPHIPVLDISHGAKLVPWQGNWCIPLKLSTTGHTVSLRVPAAVRLPSLHDGHGTWRSHITADFRLGSMWPVYDSKDTANNHDD